ncbi:CoA-disulfide reductase [Bacillus safensis]|uniref:CoA-disulfide reductase n=1 Tax=Bacillus safensis TaxID=561879 RepID=UPI0022372D58|nr:CoA-disulfide reductase [Bacillus safensis]MCW4644561.1 CoA-disulfide reductase [Bacillus safensis]MCY7566609.1 CoA-disulfide reductase [Bacillus safensis]MCY7626241.1 CoA-disulfide reductase [Bacillus safensis]MCY7634142.1 CoA-disulfide reductase [Bacillus safensis]MCY7649119.1 CoA-disulfide reductase [Bacillus safensis]
MKYVMIGGDAAGMSCAMQIYREDPDAYIVAFEKGEIFSYGQCGLPYLIGGLIDDHRKLIARSAETFREKYGIDARCLHEVTSIDPEQKTVSGHHTKTKEPFTESYDRLLIATGASPVTLNLDSQPLEGVHVLKTIPHALSILEHLEKDITHVTIIGGGYIGLEMAENLKALGKNVHIIQRGAALGPGFDSDMAKHLKEEADAKGIHVSLGETVQQLEGKSHVTAVITDKQTIQTDMVIMAIGVTPQTSFLHNTGIKRLQNGAIAVNQYMQTNIKDIYAAGDCAATYHRIKKSLDYIPLGTTANKQGRIAGFHMTGTNRAFQGVTGTAVMKFMDVTAGRTGLSEKEAKEADIPFSVITIDSTDHAKYYPEAQKMKVKLIYRSDDHTLLGAQIIGRNGVDKRIDIVAAALYQELTITDLEDLDISYAPPFNSVWDPLQQAARRI